MKPAHRRGNYQRRAADIRRQADANPNTLCWRCGQPARPDDPWQAGHTRDGDPTAPLLPEHRTCNTSAGATAANRRRGGITTTQLW